VYGQTDPAFTFTIPYQYGDTGTALATAPACSGERRHHRTGSTPSLPLADAANYTLNDRRTSTLTVGAAVLTVIPDNQDATAS